jgi:hypothetical protein
VKSSHLQEETYCGECGRVHGRRDTGWKTDRGDLIETKSCSSLCNNDEMGTACHLTAQQEATHPLGRGESDTDTINLPTSKRRIKELPCTAHSLRRSHAETFERTVQYL